MLMRARKNRLAHYACWLKSSSSGPSRAALSSTAEGLHSKGSCFPACNLNLTGEPLGATPCHLVSSGEEVADALIDISVNAAECRSTRPVAESSPFSTLSHSPVAAPYIGTCAQALCEDRIVVCPDVATDTRFDAGWRRLYLDFGLRSVQSAPPTRCGSSGKPHRWTRPRHRTRNRSGS